jgi:hypothetical protein
LENRSEKTFDGVPIEALLLFIQNNVITFGQYVKTQSVESLIEQIADGVTRKSDSVKQIVHQVVNLLVQSPNLFTKIMTEVRRWKSVEENRDLYMKIYVCFIEEVKTRGVEFRGEFIKLEATPLLTTSTNENYLTRKSTTYVLLVQSYSRLHSRQVQRLFNGLMIY